MLWVPWARISGLSAGQCWFLCLALFFLSSQIYFSVLVSLRAAESKRQTGFRFWEADERVELYRELLAAEVKVFLVDPVVLIPLVRQDSRNWISRDPAIKWMFHKYAQKDPEEPPNTVLAGILANSSQDMTSVIELISKVGQRLRFEVKVCEEESPGEIQISPPSAGSQIRTQVILIKDMTKLQIILFHSVLNATFYWASGLPTNGSCLGRAHDLGFEARNPFDIPLGTRPTLFDTFQLKSRTVLIRRGSRAQVISVLVPANVPRFLQEVPHSAYVQCNRDYSNYFQSKYGATVAEQARSDADSRFTLSQIKGILKGSLIPFWACCGTLLGWYRQCGTIPYTPDLDFCTFSSFASESLVQKVRAKAQASGRFEFMWRFGFPEAGLELVLETVPTPTAEAAYRADLFFMYPGTQEFPELEGNETVEPVELEQTWVNYLHWYETHSYQFYHSPVVTDFCSADLLGIKIQVPCDPLPSLLNDYGPDWKIPATEFDYGGNLSGMKYWAQEQIPGSFVTYKMSEAELN